MPSGFGEEEYLCFSHCKSMGANDPRGGTIFDPRGMVGRIFFKEDHCMLHTKYESSGPCGFGDDFSPGFNWCFFSFAPELHVVSHLYLLRRAAYSICESSFLIHHGVYYDLFV